MSVVNNNLLLTGDDGYRIERSLRFRSSASAYLSRTPSTAGNRKTLTYSAWVKVAAIGSSDLMLFTSRDAGSTYFGQIQIGASGSPVLQVVSASFTLRTTQLFRDPSAWYHIVVAIDTTQATSTNRVKIYINGVQVTAFGTATYPSQNADTDFNQAVQHSIASLQPFGGNYFDGYLTEINFVDGQALTPSSFGEFNALTGVWQPKAYAGTYGTNGFYLNFKDNASTSALGTDYSGNGNNWTTNNISLTAGATYDSMIDVPTPYADGGNGRGNYAVLNPVSGYSVTLTSGNLNYTTGNSANPVTSTFSLPTTGKWYWEVTVSSVGEAMIGIQSRSNLAYAGPKTVYYRLGGANDSIFIEGSLNAYNASSYTNGDVIAVGFDADNSQIRWYKNNVQQGGPYTLTSLNDLTPIIIQGSLSGNNSGSINFGQRPFAYTPPTGFKALNTQNLPEPVIAKGGEHFNTVLYTGNGSTQSITGVGFQPDFTWVKQRDGTRDHTLLDVLRNDGTLWRRLESNNTDAEVSTGGFVSFDTDGFSLGSGTAQVNNSGSSFVAWNWKANGAGVTNTAGSITSTVSANPTAGFSIVTYTGTGANATVGHGLGVAPRMIIIKNRDGTPRDWGVYHAGNTSSPATQRLLLSSTAATDTNNGYWNDTLPSSSVFTIGNNANVNPSGTNLVAYCFSEVAGYSRFGSYTGNGSADGPFVFCGFRPAFVVAKRIDFENSWNIVDSKRSPYNLINTNLAANNSNAEGTNDFFDFTSNGFKVRTSNGYINASGGTWIFMAFAESPFKHALAR
jgi:hypothetical protein